MSQLDGPSVCGVARVATSADDTAELADCSDDVFLRELAADPFVRASVAALAPDLETDYARWLTGNELSPKKVARLRRSLEKYRSRARSRATPLARFAYVAPVEVGETRGRHADLDRFVTPDLTAASTLALDSILEQPEPTTRVIQSALVHRRGDSFELSFVQSPSLKDLEVADLVSPVRIAASPAVTNILTLAEDATPYADLREKAGRALGVDPSRLDPLLRKLIASQFLVTETYPLQAVVPRRLEVQEKTGPGIEVLTSSTPATLHPDLHRRAATLISDLHRLTPIYGSRARTTFWMDFSEKFGFESPMRFVDVVDPVRGIGPLGEKLDVEDKEPAQGALLASKVFAARSSGPVEIDDTDMDVLALRGPATTEHDGIVTVCGGADDPASIIAPPLGLGLTQPGLMVGRFAVEPTIKHFWRTRLASQAQESTEVVEVVTCVRRAQTQQVASRPSSTEARVLYAGIMPEAGQPLQRLDDVTITLTHGGDFVFHSVSRGNRLVFTTADMVFLPLNGPAAISTLVELSQPALPCGIWDWGDLDRLPRLPRVLRRGNIMSRERWNPPLRVRTTDDGAWDKVFDRWCEEHEVPEIVDVGALDNRLVLRRDLRRHRDILRSVLQKLDTDLREPYSALSGPSGRYVANEWILPGTVTPSSSLGSDPGGVARLTSFPNPPTTVRTDPAWTSLNVYLPDFLLEPFLRGTYRQLLEEVRESSGRDVSSFFVRYRDPLPHLRLRFRDLPDVVLAGILRRLHALVNDARVSSFAVVPYVPEVGRYGGTTAMSAAESYFCAESAVVREILDEPDAARVGLGVAYLRRMAEATLGDAWAATVVREIMKPNVTRSSHGSAPSVPDAGHLDGTSGSQDRAVDAALEWAHLVGADRFGEIVPDIVHMLYNRLVGIDQAGEARFIAAFRGVALRRLYWKGEGHVG